MWIDYTKRFQISSDNYLTAVINYIHQNSVKHGFTTKTEDWTFSSYHSMLSPKPTLLSRNEVIDWFGGTEGYVSFHANSVTELLEEIEY
ncbi:MAG: putative transposase [Cyclobacteriaceae bacterium]